MYVGYLSAERYAGCVYKLEIERDCYKPVFTTCLVTSIRQFILRVEYNAEIDLQLKEWLYLLILSRTNLNNFYSKNNEDKLIFIFSHITL